MPYAKVHAPIYGYMKGSRHTIPLHLVHYARTFSIFKLMNTLEFSSVLNVGGAEGYHSWFIERLFGAKVVTADIQTKALTKARNFYGIDVCAADARALPFADNSFDLVVCIETIEHVPNPQRVVDELKRVARKTVLVSTESYFDSPEQRTAFLEYLRETHPQFFRVKNPVTPSDVNHFTADDFKQLFGSETIKFFPQFNNKHAEIIAPIEEVRKHVQKMTEGIEVSKASKVIVLFEKEDSAPRKKKLAEEKILDRLILDKPFFPLEMDPEMEDEDRETVERLKDWHARKDRCKVVDPAETPIKKIQEPGAKGMSLQWLTPDELELSPRFCTRRVTLDEKGHTPVRRHDWEHQIIVLSGKGVLREKIGDSTLMPGMAALVRPGVEFQILSTEGELVYLDIIPSITNFFGR